MWKAIDLPLPKSGEVVVFCDDMWKIIAVCLVWHNIHHVVGSKTWSCVGKEVWIKVISPPNVNLVMYIFGGKVIRGCGSSASALHAESPAFDSPHLHDCNIRMVTCSTHVGCYDSALIAQW